MKQLRREREAADLFQPSKFSGDGFLGTDTRTVEAIIAADRATIESFCTTCETIAAQLTAIFDTTEKALGDPVELAPGVVATHYEARGKVPSPFRGDGVFQKGEVTIENKNNGTSLRLTRLGIAMIGKHGFFQGIGSSYRIDPEAVVLFGR